MSRGDKPGSTKKDRRAGEVGSEISTGAFDDTLRASDFAGELGHEFPVVDPEAYQLGPEFARGGLGRILEAKDTRLDRIVALKELITGEPRAQARFVREALITARLEHPSIVPIHEAGRWPDGNRFYSMKLVEGRTLSEALEQASTKEERLALLPHVIDVADAVAYAHSEGVLHRDLKPANVLVGAFGETVLIDWGLAKDLRDPDFDSADTLPVQRTDSSLKTQDGIVVGTPPYMAPEQAAAQPLDERADVYSIGAMLYQVLSGRRPYEEVEPQQVLREVVTRPPRSLRTLAKDLPPDLIAIVEKAMSRDPDRRYPSAKEMAEELRRFTTGQLVRAHEYTFWEIARRFVRRQLPAVATATFAILVLIAGGIWSLENIRGERNQAQANAELARRQVEQLKLEKARSLLAIDPTLALAWEKKLAAPLPGAASIAAEAIDRGVARHILDGHVDRVLMVRISPRGDRIASSSEDGTVRLWSPLTGEGRVVDEHGARVSSIDFSPDGRFLASASHDRTVRIYDVETATSVELGGHEAGVMHVIWSADGRKLASSSEDGTVRIWDALRREPALVLRAPDATRNVMAAFSPDGKKLVTGGHGSTVYLFDLIAGVRADLAGHRGDVTHVAFSRGGETFASASADGTVRIWSVASGRARVFDGHEGGVLFVAYSPDGKRIASAGLDGTVRLFTLEGQPLSVLRGHAERVHELAFAASGRRLASASWDHTLRVWDFETGESLPLLGHGEFVSSVSFGPDGLSVASGSWDRTVRLWKLDSQRRRVFPEHEIGVHAVDISPDGRLLASGGHDNTVRIYDLESGTSRAFLGHRDHVFRVLFSPSGQHVASSSDDRTVRVWNVLDGSSTVLSGHRADVEELAFSPDGKQLASAGEDAVVRLWDTATGTSAALEGHDSAVTAVAFDASGERLASSSRDGTAIIWPKAGAPLVLSAHEDEVWDVAFAPDGTLATASVDGTVRLWSTRGVPIRVYSGLGRARMVAFSPKGEELAVGGDGLWLCDRGSSTCRALAGHRAEVLDLAFDSGGALVTASADQTVRLWDRETLECHVLRGHRAAVFDVAISPAGDLIASAGGDSDVRIWPFVLPPKPNELAAWLSQMTSATVEEP
jgi:WD40 repeat protein/serine/threonine protein kinase